LGVVTYLITFWDIVSRLKVEKYVEGIFEMERH
jgi:hypothetical protein